jgi:hypothetical protein
MLGHGLTGNVAQFLNFLSDIFGDVVRPMLQSVKGHDANGIIEQSGHKVVDDGFKVGALNLGLAVEFAAAEAINDEIDRLIRAVRNGGRRLACSGHRNTPTQQEPGRQVNRTPTTKFRCSARDFRLLH